VQMNVLPGPRSSNSYHEDENPDGIIQRLEALATFKTDSFHQLYVAKGIKQVQRHSTVFIHKDPAEMTFHALQDTVRELKVRLSGALAMEAALAAAHSELAVLRSSASVPQQITDLRAALADAGAKLARIALTPSQGDIPQELLALPAPEGVCVGGGRTAADWSALGQPEDDAEWEEMQIVWESEEHDLQHVTSIRITRDISVSQLCHRLSIAAADGAPGTVCCTSPYTICIAPLEEESSVTPHCCVGDNVPIFCSLSLTHSLTRIHTHLSVSVCTSVSVCLCAHLCLSVCTYVSVRVCVCVCVCVIQGDSKLPALALLLVEPHPHASRKAGGFSRHPFS